MNKKKIGVLIATFAFTAATNAAFDRRGAYNYSNVSEVSDFISDELPLLQFVPLDFEVGGAMPFALAPVEAVGSQAVSLIAKPVPVPSAVWFFSSALVALTVIQRRV